MADSTPQEAFSAAFRPWFELPRGNSDFELVLESPRDSAHHAKEFLAVLLDSHFSDVGKLTIRTEPILSSFRQFTRHYPQIHNLTLGVAGRSVDMDPKIFSDLETIFPSLQIFCIDGYSPLAILPVHSNLQSFIFGGSALSCTALEVHRCLAGLPRLENLLLSCTQSIPRERLDPLPSEGILVHRNLKKLMLVGEQLLERFTFVALPSLQTLHITGWGMRMAHDVTRATTRLQSLIERSDLQHLDVRIDGVVSIPFLSNAIDVLSIPSRLFVGFFGIRQGPQVLYPQDIEEFAGPKITIPANGLKEIICNENTGSLVWLSGGDQRSSPLDLHVPTNYLGQRKISVEKISDCGLNLRIHPDSEIDAMFICDPRFEGHMVLG